MDEQSSIFRGLESVSSVSLALGLIFLFVITIFAFSRKYIHFLTMRYLTHRFLSYVSIVFISFSVAALVVVPSIMNGFAFEFRKKVRGTLSDLMIWGPTPFSFPAPETYDTVKEPEKRMAIQQAVLDEIYKELRAVPGVAEVSPYIENPALYRHLKTIDYCFVRGILPRSEAKVTKFESYLLSPRETYRQLQEDELRYEKDKEIIKRHEELLRELPDKVDTDKLYEMLENGVKLRFALSQNNPNSKIVERKLPAAIVGLYFLKSYRLSIGDVIELTTASDSEEVSEKFRLVIVGAFKSGFYEPDRRKLYVNLKTAQDFIKIERRVSGISVKCQKGIKARDLREEIGKFVSELIYEGKFPARSPARTWEEKDANLLQAVAMERRLIRIIVFFIVLMAMGSIFVVLLMSVREKARDLGVLKALGGTNQGILSIYIGQGILMTLIGVFFGVIIGTIAAIYLNEIADGLHAMTGWHPFPPDIYYLDKIPRLIDVGEIMSIIGVTTVVAILMAVVPGLWASYLDPVESVRID